MTTAEPKNLILTPISEIKKKSQEIKEGILTELPSGIVVRLARPSLTKMLKDGIIPGNLIQASLKQSQGIVAMTDKEIKESIEVVELLVMEAIKEPKIVRENADENSLNLYELSDEDRGFVFQYIQSGATDLTLFRSKR